MLNIFSIPSIGCTNIQTARLKITRMDGKIQIVLNVTAPHRGNQPRFALTAMDKTGLIIKRIPVAVAIKQRINLVIHQVGTTHLM